MNARYVSAWLAALAASLVIGACTKAAPTIEAAIDCAQFERNSNGAWVAKTSVSLDYMRDGRQYQENFAQGVEVTKAGSEGAFIEAALQKKCTP